MRTQGKKSRRRHPSLHFASAFPKNRSRGLLMHEGSHDVTFQVAPFRNRTLLLDVETVRRSSQRYSFGHSPGRSVYDTDKVVLGRLDIDNLPVRMRRRLSGKRANINRT